MGGPRKSFHSQAYERFLERLIRARLDAGLTQIEVARRLRRPQSYVSKCESGERRVDVVELAEFAEVYRKPLDFFLPTMAPRRKSDTVLTRPPERPKFKGRLS